MSLFRDPMCPRGFCKGGPKFQGYVPPLKLSPSSQSIQGVNSSMSAPLGRGCFLRGMPAWSMFWNFCLLLAGVFVEPHGAPRGFWQEAYFALGRRGHSREQKGPSRGEVGMEESEPQTRSVLRVFDMGTCYAGLGFYTADLDTWSDRVAFLGKLFGGGYDPGHNET